MQNADAFSQKVPLSHCRQRKQTYTLQLHFYNKTPFKTQSLTIRLKQTQTQSTETQRKHKAKNTTETKIALECTPLPSLLSTKSKPAENTETCKKPTVVHFGVSSHQVITSFLIEHCPSVQNSAREFSIYKTQHVTSYKSHTFSSPLIRRIYKCLVGLGVV